MGAHGKALRPGGDTLEQAAWLLVSGEVDLAEVPAIEARVRSELAAGALRIVLDMREVTFIDSSGLAMLLRLNSEVVPPAQLQVVVLPGSPIEELVYLTHTADRLPLLTVPPGDRSSRLRLDHHDRTPRL